MASDDPNIFYVSKGFLGKLPVQTGRCLADFWICCQLKAPWMTTWVHLGFIWKGQLYITGRLKEIIKIFGRTLHPVDIELWATRSHSDLRSGSVAAFPVHINPLTGLPYSDAGDRLVIVAELNKRCNPDQVSSSDIVNAIRQAVQTTFSVPCHAIILGRPGQLIRKTTSGKIQRLKLRSLFQEGRFTRRPDLISPRSPLFNALLHVSTAMTPANFRATSFGMQSVPVTPTIMSNPGPRSFSFRTTCNIHTNEGRMRRLCAAAQDFGLTEQICQLVQLNATMSVARNSLGREGSVKRRSFHPVGVGAFGHIHLADLAQGFFHQETSSQLRAAIRFSNVMSGDDAQPQIRGAALRLYSQEDIMTPLFDLILQSGDGRNIFPTLQLAVNLFKDPDYAIDLPLRQAQLSAVRQVPGSFSDLHYFAAHTYSWQSTSWARFRLRHQNCQVDLPPYSNDINCDLLNITRSEDDYRDPSFLRQRFMEDCRCPGGQRFLLEVQIRPKSNDDAIDITLQDGLILWDDCAWQLFAEIDLNHLLPDDIVERMRFNIANSPTDVEIVAGTDCHHPASSAQSRAITYAIASNLRCGLALPDYLVVFLRKPGPPPMLFTSDSCTTITQCPSVAVIGAGVSGLAMAMALEKRGYQVVVLEAAANVGGKASSLWIDGKVFDWGGHLCNNSYHCIRALVNRFDLRIEPAAPALMFDCDHRLSSPCNIFTQDEAEQFQSMIRAMKEEFGSSDTITAPLTEWAGSVEIPWRQWIEQDPIRKSVLLPVILQMNSCGFGFSLEHDISLALLAKLVVLSDEFRSVGWTLTNGMGSLYDAMSSSLDDLRLNSPVVQIERLDDAVHVHLSNGETIIADHVISSLSLPQTISLLNDPTESELAVAKAVQTFSYFTTVARCHGLDKYPIGFHIMDQHNDPDTAKMKVGHVVAWHKRYIDCEIFLFYSFGHDLNSGDLVQDFVRQDVSEILGGEVIEIVSQRSFDFFPYGSSNRFYPMLSEIQGYKHLWHIGSAFNIELMEGNIAFAQYLAQVHFPRVNNNLIMTPTSSSIAAMQPILTETELFVVDAILEESTESFDIDQISAVSKLSNFGITSVALPALAYKFSEYSCGQIRILDCAMYPTIKELAAFIDRVRQESQQLFQCIKHVRPKVGSEGRMLFMVHDGLGRTHQYLTDRPQSTYPLSLIQPYWEAQNASVISSLDDVATLYVDIIKKEQPQGPWRLGGYSLGAMLAWRMAQLLENVDRLILIDCPSVPPVNSQDVVADINVLRTLQMQFSAMQHFEHSCALTDRIFFEPLLFGKRSGPTLVIVGSRGIAMEMKLATGNELQQSWKQAIGSGLHFVEIDGASHLNIMLSPYVDQVHAEIEKFLR